MKKIILSAIALVLMGSACCVEAYAQKAKLTPEEKAAQKAFDGYLKEAKKNGTIDEMNPAPKDLTAARTAIQAAAKMPMAEGNAKFYLQAAQVENAAFTVAAQANDLPNYAAAAQAGFDYFKKAYSAATAAPKVDNKIVAAAQQGAFQIFQQTSGLAMIGNVFYQMEDYRKCLEAFRTAKTAANEPVLTSNPLAKSLLDVYLADSTINNLSLNCFSVAQYQLQDTAAANEELIFIKNNPADDTQLNQIMQQLALNYYGADDTIAFENTLTEGMRRLPNEPWYINNLINIYINRGDLASASKFLDQAIESDPQNVALLNTKGMLVEQQGNVDEALGYYEKALAIDPTNASVNSSLGRYYFNRALATEDEYYNKKKFEEGDRQAAPLYEKSIPYYETAYAFDSDRKDKNVAIALRNLYGKKIARLGSSSAEAKELSAKRAEVSAAYGFE